MEDEKKIIFSECQTNLLAKFSEEKDKLVQSLAEKDSVIKILTSEKNKSIEEFNLRKELEVLNIKNTLIQNFSEEKNKLVERYENTVNDLQKQIHELDTANKVNKAINSKIKGTNFENYFIEAINKVTVLVDDVVEKISHTGIKADFIHYIKTNNVEVGSIVYELKDTEKWDDRWINKFAEDILIEKGDYGILISNNVKDKYGLPFLQTNNPKIFAVEPDSFEFVMSFVRKLVIVEKKLAKTGTDNYKINKLNEWMSGNLELFKSIFYKTMSDNEAREQTISNKLKEFDKARKGLITAFEQKILDEIESFI